MHNKVIDNMIPIEVSRGKYKTIWHLDVSKLSLSELIELKNELIGKSNKSIASIDAIIHQEANTTYEEINFSKRMVAKTKYGYRTSKVKHKMKRLGR